MYQIHKVFLVPVDFVFTSWKMFKLKFKFFFIGDTVTIEDKERVKFLMAGQTGVRKVANCIPHDIGDPGEMI